MEGAMTAITASDRFAGALVGLAAGDALGTTVEFKSRDTFPPVTDIVGGGPFRLQPGQWTDDTSMALCMAESLVHCRGFDAADQMRRYVRWFREGHWSSTGRCFDIGGATSAALQKFERTGDPMAGSRDPQTAGNGSLMRLAPVVLAHAGDAEQAIAMAGESSRTTHAVPEAVDACRYMAALLVGALRGESRERLLSPRYSPVEGLWDRQPLMPAVDAIAAGSFAAKDRSAIRSGGYVIDTLEAALWGVAGSADFASGALAVVNLGDDADTTGAVYGQLAGAIHGYSGIPLAWRQRIAMHDQIVDLARQLEELSGATAGRDGVTRWRDAMA
jgi:ADP-ribosyl-[dinitrogen reductase] hydrolase